jgi:hypothetical protein
VLATHSLLSTQMERVASKGMQQLLEHSEFFRHGSLHKLLMHNVG